IWAGRKAGYLLDQIRLNGESDEVKEELIELAREFGIATPYTSLLVVPPSSPAPRGGASPPDTGAARPADLPGQGDLAASRRGGGLNAAAGMRSGGWSTWGRMGMGGIGGGMGMAGMGGMGGGEGGRGGGLGGMGGMSGGMGGMGLPASGGDGAGSGAGAGFASVPLPGPAPRARSRHRREAVNPGARIVPAAGLPTAGKAAVDL